MARPLRVEFPAACYRGTCRSLLDGVSRSTPKASPSTAWSARLRRARVVAGFCKGLYHVINRGRFRFPVFEEDRERERVPDRLVDFAEGFGVHVRAIAGRSTTFTGLTELGERLGPVTVSGLGSARRIMARRLRESRTLRDRVTAMEARLADPEKQIG